MSETPVPSKSKHFGLSLLDSSPLPEDKEPPMQEDEPEDRKQMVAKANQWKDELDDLNTKMTAAFLENIYQKDRFLMIGVELSVEEQDERQRS